jgi:RNA:NAD 2'-phosphotransferase (TPT1/KptA family)
MSRGNAAIQKAQEEAAVAAAALSVAAGSGGDGGAGGGAAASGPAVLKKAVTGRNLGRTMTRILRHAALDNGLEMAPDGYVSMAALLAIPLFAGVTLEQVESVVEADAKGRFKIDYGSTGGGEEGGGGGGGSRNTDVIKIRANQGHSILSVDPSRLLTAITDPSQAPIAVHGTVRVFRQRFTLTRMPLGFTPLFRL